MANDTVILRGARVLAVNHNAYTKNGEEKNFYSGFIFVPGEREGDPKPQVVEIDTVEPDRHAELAALINKNVNIVVDKLQLGKFQKYTYLSSLDVFLKGLQ